MRRGGYGRINRSNPATGRARMLRRSVIVSAAVLAFAAPVGLIAFAASTVPFAHAETAIAVPPPAADEPAQASRVETAVIAGGCFWGIQAIYQHVTGVTNAVSGYA